MSFKGFRLSDGTLVNADEEWVMIDEIALASGDSPSINVTLDKKYKKLAITYSYCTFSGAGTLCWKDNTISTMRAFAITTTAGHAYKLELVPNPTYYTDDYKNIMTMDRLLNGSYAAIHQQHNGVIENITEFSFYPNTSVTLTSTSTVRVWGVLA